VRIAYYSPLPPERSGIADYSALLLPALEQRLDVTVVGPRTRRRPRGVDLRLYHVGNNAEAHGWIVDELRRTSGVVVLHDFVLHHLVAGLTLGRGDRSGYLDAMQAEAGLVGRSLAHAVIDGLLPPLWEVRPQDFPLAGSIAQFASGLIVHSRLVEQEARRAGYEGPIWRIPMPAWPDPPTARASLPRAAAPVIGCLGRLNPAKRIPQLIQAFSLVQERFPEAILVLAGHRTAGLDLDALLARHGLEDGRDALVFDHVEESRLWALMSACDICVNLRFPTMGETSAAALRVLSLGKPLVVSDVGWFAELPDSVAAKVPVDEWEVETLARMLTLLAERPDVREAMGRAARAYVTEEHDLDRVADLYVAAIEEAAGGDEVRDAVLAQVAATAHDVGFKISDPELRRLSSAVREIGLLGSEPKQSAT
jgi:glycosyltransferase involved in cell wall biosynthesis